MSNVPEVRIERTDTSGTASRIEVRVRVHNFSSDRVEIIEHEALGQRQGVSHQLDSGSTVDIVVYRGTPPKDTHYNRMFIRFKRKGDGRNFRADHYIEYNRRIVGDSVWYEPSRIELQGQIYEN